MAAGYSDNGKNVMLDALGAVAVWASLHTADPGAGGANEVTGGTPAYARKAITWNAAAAGVLDSSNQPVFDVPACTVAYVGFFSAAAAGTFYGSGDVTDEVFAAQGTYTLTDADLDLNLVCP
jgi:hypothetical protein